MLRGSNALVFHSFTCKLNITCRGQESIVRESDQPRKQALELRTFASQLSAPHRLFQIVHSSLKGWMYRSTAHTYRFPSAWSLCAIHNKFESSHGTFLSGRFRRMLFWVVLVTVLKCRYGSEMALVGKCSYLNCFFGIGTTLNVVLSICFTLIIFTRPASSRSFHVHWNTTNSMWVESCTSSLVECTSS